MHSPAAPAHMMRSPRTRVTAFVTGARPVPSHRLARMIAIVGSGGTVWRRRGAVPLQAPKTSVGIRTEERPERYRFILRSWRWWAARPLSRGGRLHRTYFKMRGRNAFGRDSQAGLHGD